MTTITKTPSNTWMAIIRKRGCPTTIAIIDYLQIAIGKTAGNEEREAWQWLMQRVSSHRARACA